MPLSSLFRLLGFRSASAPRGRRSPRRKPGFAGTLRAKRIGSGLENLEDRRLLSVSEMVINPTGNANPANFAVLNGSALFAANDGTDGVELWRSDGTASGTVLVKDINPGSTVVGSAQLPNSSNPTDLVTVGGYVYFAANDGADGTQLWRSDGTAAGTTMVTDSNVAGGGFSPSDLINANGTLYFTANDGTDGLQVWKSDGTTAGTVMVSNIQPTTGTANPASLTNVDGEVFFTANTGTSGVQLWETNGTLTNTHIVLTIVNNTSSVGPNPTNLTAVGSKLFFDTNQSATGDELWVSDGTSTGTNLVADINPGAASSNPSYLTNVNGTLFFAADDGTHGVQLWKSDGTTAGTVMVSDINSTSAGASSNPADLTNVNGVLYFRASDGIHGVQLWKSDGTAAGTAMVDQINPSGDSTPDNLTNGNGELFFSANDGTHGTELWQSNGTAAGTTMVQDINPGAASSSPAGLTNIGTTLLFSATNGTAGVQLWSTALPPLPPVGANGTYIFNPGGTLSVSAPGVLTGASGPAAQTLTAVLVTGPTHGLLTLNADGSFTYTPNAGFDGVDSFTFNVQDTFATSAVPATVTLESHNYAWVNGLYLDTLHRTQADVTSGEVMYWVTQIDAGATRTQVAADFTNSTEYRTNLIDGYYEQFLARPVDAGGLSFMLTLMSEGASSADIELEILSSQEFFLDSGGTDSGFVSNLYADLLGRTPTTSEAGFWTQALVSGGATPLEVAAQFLISPEYETDNINALYEHYLNRAVDSGALTFWLNELNAGATFQDVETAIAASNEFYNLV